MEICKANTGHIMANTSDGEIIDWRPKGDPLDKNNNLDLPILLNNTLDSMNNIVNSSIYWHGGSFSAPLPQLPHMPLHSKLWKISAASQLITAWKGQFNSTVSGHSLHFDKNSTHWIKSCICLPFIFLIGPTFYNASSGLLTCQNCSFYICINSSLQFQNECSLYILKTRSGVWLPVKMNRPWQDSPTVYTVEEILKRVLKHTERFIGLLSAAILGIIAIATTAAVAGRHYFRVYRLCTLCKNGIKILMLFGLPEDQ